MFSVAHGLAATDTFYPQLNDISWITDASLGVYGASYEAPAEEASPFPPHGSYDYCTMPHPRVEEYLLPTAVANGSLDPKSLKPLTSLKDIREERRIISSQAARCAPFSMIILLLSKVLTVLADGRI